MSPPSGPSGGGRARPGEKAPRPSDETGSSDATGRGGSGPAGSGPTGSAAIRAASARDARPLAALMARIYAEGRWFVGDMGPGAETLARQLRSIDPSREIVLVAEAVGTGASSAELVGWIEGRRYGPSRLEHVASLTIAVAPDARGRGVGGRLMRAIVPWARRVGVRKLRLDVRAGNEAALALYRAEGYEVEGIERDQIRDVDGFEDNIVMARFLGPERDAPPDDTARRGRRADPERDR